MTNYDEDDFRDDEASDMDWERHAGESDEDYRERMQDLEDYMEYNS